MSLRIHACQTPSRTRAHPCAANTHPDLASAHLDQFVRCKCPSYLSRHAAVHPFTLLDMPSCSHLPCDTRPRAPLRALQIPIRSLQVHIRSAASAHPGVASAHPCAASTHPDVASAHLDQSVRCKSPSYLSRHAAMHPFTLLDTHRAATYPATHAPVQPSTPPFSHLPCKAWPNTAIYPAKQAPVQLSLPMRSRRCKCPSRPIRALQVPFSAHAVRRMYASRRCKCPS